MENNGKQKAPETATKCFDFYCKFFIEKNSSEFKALDEAFTPKQKEILQVLFGPIMSSITRHIVEDEEPHFKSISTLKEDVTAKLRNHRHELGKTYSSKPEF